LSGMLVSTLALGQWNGPGAISCMSPVAPGFELGRDFKCSLLRI
jgi:hypothetical protein